MSSTVLAQATPQSIIIEVPNQNSFEIQAKTNVDNNITQLPVVSKISSEVKDTHDTPDDRLKPPKNKSMSTPRRRSTHIRCLDFSTPQPKNIRDQARSKLFCDTPRRFEKVIEEPESSPLPKLQADWGSVNGFESMVNKETSRHWDTDIREMVGAGILTSDADGRKTRKKKTPRKKIMSINDQNNSEVVIKEDELNNSMQTNESQSNTETNKSNTFKNICALNDQNYDKSLLDDKKSLEKQSEFPILLETSDKIPESCFKEPLDKSLNDQDSLKTQNEFIVSLETPDKITELCNEQPIKSNSLSNFVDKKHGEFPISLETPDKITELCNEQPIKSNSLTNFIDKKHGEFPISLETPDKITELCKEQPIKSNSLTNFNDKKHGEFPISLETPDKITELCNKPIESNSLKDVNNKKHSEFSMSLETPDKIAELCIKQPIKSDTTKNLNDKKLLQKHSEFPKLLENPDKISASCNKQTTIESNSVKISSQTLNKLELSDTNINEQENNLNQLNTLTTASTAIKSTIASTSKSVLEITKKSKEKDSNFLETFNNHNYLKPLLIKQPENNLNKPTENVKEQILLDQIETSHLDELNSPVKCGVDKIQPIKHLVETPFKCDDAAVDVPETPISKLIREYDPSKLITPLPCTPEHDEESLTETPLTKVFRETSYLNRPPISPFPPTPGNSRSVDTLLVQSDQECSKISNNICSNVNGLKEFLTQTISKDKESPIQTKKVKSLQWKTKPKPLTKSKVKYEIKEKSVEAKKKQVYESVKVELFGSEISSSSSADELEKTNQQPKPIVLNIKQEDKKSGFKRIPQKKSIQSSPVLVNGIENNPLDEFNTKISKSLSIKPTIVPSKEGFLQETKNTSNIKKSKNSMVHFDDPVEEIFNTSTNSTLNQSKRVNMNKIQKKTVTNENPEQLIGLSRYLNKSFESNECNYINKKRSKTTESEVKTSKLYSSDNINNSGTSKGDRSGEKISEIKPYFLNDKTKTYGTSNLQNKSSEKYLINENKKSNNRKEKNTVLKKSIEPLNIVKPTFTDAKTSDQNSISKKPTNNTSLDRNSQSNSTVSNNNTSMNNTSCITVGHDDESNFQLRKFDVPLNNMEYLKIPKVYEIISEDGVHEVRLEY